MRIIKEVSLRDFKVTLYHWNNRYLIKLEQGFLEQTFKIDQFDLTGEEDLLSVLDEVFLEEAGRRFADMATSLNAAIGRSQSHG